MRINHLYQFVQQENDQITAVKGKQKKRNVQCDEEEERRGSRSCFIRSFRGCINEIMDQNYYVMKEQTT